MKNVSPYYVNVIKIPRKLKKKVKSFCWVHWSGLTNEQRLWQYLEKGNPNLKREILGMITKQNDSFYV